MAIIKLSNRNAPIYKTPECTEMLTVLEPEIIAMSLIEVDYTTYYFNSNMKATGIINDGDAWIKLVPFENTILLEYTNTAPVWDEIRKGYYESGTNNKYLLKFLKAGNEFQNKKLIYDRYGNIDIFVMNKVLKNAVNDIILIKDEIDKLKFTYFPTNSYKKIFNSPGTLPYGLAFDGVNLISYDGNTNKIYIHDGITKNILSEFNAPAGSTRGLVFDGVNLISANQSDSKIYIHDGISANILSSFNSPAAGVSGITFDGVNLISTNTSTDRIYIHDGITANVLSSFTAPSTGPSCLAFDGVNLISGDTVSDKIYIHDKITKSILSSFTASGGLIFGLTFALNNLISCDNTNAEIYVHYSQALR